jgi:putative transposase
MLFVLWLTVRLLTRLLVLPNADDGTKDLEILVLRHQLRVLRRKTGRPKFTAADRILLAAASRVLPRQRWGIVSGHTADAPALASHVGPTEVDLPEDTQAWQTADRPADRRTDRPHGQGERSLGLCADLRRAAQARHPGGRHNHQDAAAPTRLGPGAAAHRTDLGAVPTSPGRGDRRLRLLYRGDDPPQDPLCVVLHPAQHQAGRRGRGHGASRCGMGDPAGQERRDGPQRPGRIGQVPAPRPRAKFSRGFDDVFSSEGGQVLRTPIRAPKANAYAERWIQTVRSECLDWTLVRGRRHLLRLLRTYVRHYNEQRPHRSLALAAPAPEARKQRSPQVNPRAVRRRDVLGGLIHEYHEVAA